MANTVHDLIALALNVIEKSDPSDPDIQRLFQGCQAIQENRPMIAGDVTASGVTGRMQEMADDNPDLIEEPGQGTGEGGSSVKTSPDAICYAYIDQQTASADGVLAMNGFQAFGNPDLFEVAGDQESVTLKQQCTVQMQAWCPITDNSEGQAELAFALLKEGYEPFPRANAQLTGKYAMVVYMGVLQPGDGLSLIALVPSGSVDFEAGGWITITATPLAGEAPASDAQERRAA